ncbi:hypothetical protein V6N13_117376 [Hibiscus sabdariffa]
MSETVLAKPFTIVCFGGLSIADDVVAGVDICFKGAGSGGLVAGGASIGGEVVRGAVAGGTLTGGDKFGLPGSARGALATCVARSGVLCLTLPLTLYMFLYYDMIFHILCT